MISKSSVEDLAKKVHEIRKAIGYATPEQRVDGWKHEMKSCVNLLNDAQIFKQVSSGGFRYRLLKSGNVRVTPDFSFVIKKKDIPVSKEDEE